MIRDREGDLRMIWHGHIQNGTVVVDDPAEFPDSGRVRIELLPVESASKTPTEPALLGAQLLEIAGKAEGLPADAARRHDDYLERPAGS
jgi:hypothetical protein